MRHPPSMASTANGPKGPCSRRYYQLEAASKSELEITFLRGTTPDLDQLVGWEFRGCNHTPLAYLAGVKKFIKGFYRKDGDAYGYNLAVKQNRISSPWIAKPDDDHPKPFGFYRVAAVDASSRDNAYLHSVLLNYGDGDNGALDPSRGLRDYLVQPDPDNRDLLLGKAYYALAGRRVALSFFIIERHRPGSQDLDSRS